MLNQITENMKKVIATPDAPKAVGPYSQAIEVNGTLYISGQIPVNPADGKVQEDIVAAAHQSLKNIGAILKEAGMTYDNVVKTRYTLAGCVVLFLLSVLGIYGKTFLEAVYRTDVPWTPGEVEKRYCFGMGHPNAFHCMILVVQAENVADLIAIESSIADTQYMLDVYQGQLQNYDGRIDYSTVNVTVQEVNVEEAKDIPFAERIGAGLKKSLQTGAEFARDAAVFLISASPWLAALGIIVGLFSLKIRKNKKRKNGI